MPTSFIVAGMKRVSFNAGELSPSSAVRFDLEKFHMGASRIENFDVGQMGGLRRRRGMRLFAESLPGSRIFAYVYSTEQRFLVEANDEQVRIYGVDGSLVSEMVSPWTKADIPWLRTKQVNNLLFFTVATHEPMVLSRKNGVFSLEAFSFKSRPWRYEEMRDQAVTISGDNNGYMLDFGGANEPVGNGDIVRVTANIAQQTGFLTAAEMIWNHTVFAYLHAGSYFEAGRRICVNEGAYWSWWTCKKEFGGSVDFKPGFSRLSDYPEFFNKGILCHWNTITSKGAWKFYCSGVWYGEYAVERRYADGDWELMGSSFSRIGAGSNLLLAGDESEDECYLRLMLYQSQLTDGNGPGAGFPADACGNKLVVEGYRKDIILRRRDPSSSQSVARFKFAIDQQEIDLLPDGIVYQFDRMGWYRLDPFAVAGKCWREGNYLNVAPSGLLMSNIPIMPIHAEIYVNMPASAYQWQSPNTAHTFAFYKSCYLTAGSSIKYTRGSVDATCTITRRYEDGTYRVVHSGKDSYQFSAHGGGEHELPTSGFYGVDISYNQGGFPGAGALPAVVDIDCKAGFAIVGGITYEVSTVASTSMWDNVSDIPDNSPAVASSRYWSFSAFRQSYGYPALCDVFNQRLVFAATPDQPQTIWMSKTDDLNNFEIGQKDDSALALTLSTTTQNPICWIMAQSSRLMVGTSDSEWILSGGQSVLTYANARADSHGHVGSASVPALMATDKVIYCERGGGRLYQYGYDYESDAYVSRDLTVLADHILFDGGGAVDGCFLRKPDARAVFVMASGGLALMTYNSMQEVNAWHRYTTEGKILAAASLPNGSEADSLFLIVQRESGRFIEVIDGRSGYVDNGEFDYVSIVLTNALDTLNSAGRERHTAALKMVIGSPALAGGLEVSNDGDVWVRLDRSPVSELDAGWHELVSSGKWAMSSVAGVRVYGNRGFDLLALEG